MNKSPCHVTASEREGGREREKERERERERERAMSVGRYVRYRRNSHPSREPN